MINSATGGDATGVLCPLEMGKLLDSRSIMFLLIGTLIALALGLIVTVQAMADDRAKRQQNAFAKHQEREQAFLAKYGLCYQ